MADDCKHGEGQHDQRDVPVPAVPGPALIMVKPQFGLGSLETVLDGPATAFHGHQCLHEVPAGHQVVK